MAAPVAADWAFRLRSITNEVATLKPSCSAGFKASSIRCLPGPQSWSLPVAATPTSNPRRIAPSGCRRRNSASIVSSLAIVAPEAASWSASVIKDCPPPLARHFATRSAASGAVRLSAAWAASQTDTGAPDGPGARSFFSFAAISSFRAAICAAFCAFHTLHCASRYGAAGEFRARAEAAASQIDPC